MKKLIVIISVAFIAYSFTGNKATTKFPPSDVDYEGFVALTDEAGEHRKTHTVTLEKFIELSKQTGVMILDTRSKAAYDKKHVKGAVHLNFSDFTEGKLAKVIPSKTTKVLIYCNNNLDKDEFYFARKSAPLALNIPTFINLYGYGYKNVYELDALVPTSGILLSKGPKLEFEGTYLNANKKSKPSY